MALSNLFGWKKAETETGSECGTACGAAGKPEEQQTSRKAQIVRWTIALSGPKRSGDNRQHAEQHVEQQTSQKRNQQHAEQHLEHLTSKIS